MTCVLDCEQEKFSSWDFKESDTKEYTHCIHTYPAMMIPQIARRLIFLYGKKAKNVLDPFMGSGTSLVEASLTNNIKEAYGFDLNPLAVLIAKVKTTPINIKKAEEELTKIIVSKEYKELPNFKNIDFWFKPNVIKNLAILKEAIFNIKNRKVKDFFKVCFSETVRNVSNTRNNEFKLYKMEEEKLKDYNPDVFEQFEKISRNNINGMKEYIKKRTKTKTYPKCISSMNKMPLKEESVDLIVTSPPYGDSRTTVAYGQFSRLSLQWLNYKDINSLDNELLGGKPSEDLKVNINSNTLKNIIQKISQIDKQRAREVLSFYEDFDMCIIQLNKVLAKKSFVCFVVGNRTVKKINIPTDKIMTEMFMAHGSYKYIETHTRAIPMKRMPKSNSPSNIPGETVTTMNNEFIFVLQKN